MKRTRRILFQAVFALLFVTLPAHAVDVTLTVDEHVDRPSALAAAQSNLAAVLTDANSAALKRIGAKHSWHNFCRLPMNKRSTIDFVMVSCNITPKLAEVPHECPGAMLSDHNPVITTLQLP